jgi:hypothetical protein
MTLGLKVEKVGHDLLPHHSYLCFHLMSEVWVLCSIFKLQNKAKREALHVCVCVSVFDDVLAVSVRQVEHRSAVEGYQSARFCASPQCELTSASYRGRRGEPVATFAVWCWCWWDVRTCGDEQSNVTRGVQ